MIGRAQGKAACARPGHHNPTANAKQAAGKASGRSGDNHGRKRKDNWEDDAHRR